MKKVFFILIIFSFSKKIEAQYYFYNDKFYDKNPLFEFGISGGVMNCRTDVGNSASVIKTFRATGSVYATYLYQNFVGLSLQASWGSVATADSLDKKNGSSKLRNLSFKSSIQEIALIAELHPLSIKFNPDGLPRFSPYVLAGVGWFSFNPEAQLRGQWIFLQPLHTEGEGFAEYPSRKNYRLSQINIPMGAGLKYELSPLFTLRGEFVYRYLFTDYLDDVSTIYIDPHLFAKYLSPIDAAYSKALYSRRAKVDPGYVPPPGSQRGNPKKNDGYYTFNLKVGINIGRTKYRW